MESNIIVVKRNGDQEPFSKLKVAKVMVAAGLSESQAVEIANKLEATLQKRSQPTTTSLDISVIVSKELHQIDEYAANLYDWYQKIKEDGQP